jgi:metal-responsive CopG/Arc/MetJ family transcriptional regulator
MRTTVRLDDGLMEEVKRYAAERRTTLTAVIDEALRETLARRKPMRKTKPIQLTTVRGRGLMPGIDLDDTASLLDALEK